MSIDRRHKEKDVFLATQCGSVEDWTINCNGEDDSFVGYASNDPIDTLYALELELADLLEAARKYWED